ncbi:MAG: hypothetical protein IJT36_02770 [Alphaproteobacteria bacterium]|nr:hypothetical protein [Alphaproteobacteria bacterium]
MIFLLKLVAIVIGATGAVGNVLVERLQEDDNFKSVEIFVWQNVDFVFPKFSCSCH